MLTCSDWLSKNQLKAFFQTVNYRICYVKQTGENSRHTEPAEYRFFCMRLVLIGILALEQGCNLPCSDSTLRHKLSQWYFQEEHGNSTQQNGRKVRNEESTLKKKTEKKIMIFKQIRLYVVSVMSDGWTTVILTATSSYPLQIWICWCIEHVSCSC